ncbi:30S ribosomal protein S6 [Aureispira anguillae]|uniref:Small ribosomal subunit protein bS6 n=1 Tax=Aureispira anguillae TaxID=2864201 RepID=A0A916DQT2_9BACT|nr:30S ribosomal protein S6 [Aureispira anguillae]BDS09897.1 30S ribosomal protein S6 [Aureispira anguillae]
MRQYETTFIINPALSGDEIKQTAQMYVDFLKGEGCEIIHLDEMGVLQLAYTINKRSSGAYFWLEYKAPSGDVINKMELAFRRDDNVLRYLTIKVDKHRAQYNLDKRAGKFEKKEEESADTKEEATA